MYYDNDVCQKGEKIMNEILQSLNPMQKKAVETTEGPLLLLAGAGSGKTRVITARIAYLIEKGVRPFNIMAITFTNKAAREMKERVCAATQQGSDVWVSTFHSTCVKILRRTIDHIGYSNNFTIYDADDSERLIKQIIRSMNVNEKMFTAKSVMYEISNQKNELVDPETFAKEAAGDMRFEKIAEIYAVYQAHLKANNALDFDDLIFKMVEVFKNYPDILEKYQDRFRYIMVDEYQDTNHAQYVLVKLLSSKYENLCVVGDDDQSIYGWRGADIRNILDFEKDHKDTTVIKLEQNYRSTKPILDAANTVIKNNFNRKEKNLWTEKKEGEEITFHILDSDLKEADFISSQIAEAVKNGASYNDFAILYRANALSRVIEENLVKKSIPYKLFGGINFYGRREIRDILAYLKFINNPDDDIALRRIINVPKRGIGNATVDKAAVFAQANEITLYEALCNIDEIDELKTRAKKIKEFTELMSEFTEYEKRHSVSEFIDEIIEKTGYVEELKIEGTEEAKSRIENIQELISKAVEFEKGNDDARLSSFLEDVSLIADIDALNENEDTVSLMTLHSAKGLEFPTVFIAAFEDGIFPSYRCVMDTDPNAMEEERRLCYVGITRARNKLYLTAARSRLHNGKYISNSKSRFVKELEDKVKEVIPEAIKFDKPQHATYKPMPKYVGSPKTYSNNIPEPSAGKPDFGIGDKVRQIKYGIGTVKEINNAGADYEVTVEFEGVGTKKFMAHLSKLKKVEE